MPPLLLQIDKEGANAERVKQELTEHNLVPEEWGGKTPMVEISAKKGQGVDALLETVRACRRSLPPHCQCSAGAAHTAALMPWITPCLHLVVSLRDARKLLLPSWLKPLRVMCTDEHLHRGIAQHVPFCLP
jgi:hypothetical protein